MTPRNENNFLIEVTKEVMDEIRRYWMGSDDDPVAELHYSPYWKDLATKTKSEIGELKK